MNSPAEIAKLYVDIGANKTRMPALKMFVLGIFAGMFIAMGGFGSAVASCGVVPPALSRFLSALVFPIGLMMVIIAGGELFTGNCLIILSVMQKRTTWLKMLRNWGIVYLGNLVGSLLVALVVTCSKSTTLYSGALIQAIVNTANTKVHLGFAEAILKGVFCNFMVCLAVWVAFSATDTAGKIMALYLPIFLFVLCGFEHCVANMYFIPAGIFSTYMYDIQAEGLNWLTFLVRNLLPVTVGNIIGGAGFVGMGYWWAYLHGKVE